MKTNWAQISTKKLTEEFIHIYANKLDWETMCWFQDFSMDFLREHIDYINNRKHCWTKISQGQCLTEDFIRQFADQIDWWGLCVNENFRPSLQFCREFVDKCKEVQNFFHHAKISEKELEEFINITKPSRIIEEREKRLSNDFLLKWWEKIDWWAVSKEYKLNYISLEKLKDHLQWQYVTSFQHLGIKLLEKYQDRVDWSEVRQWYYISKEMWEKFKNYLQVQEDEENA